MSKQKDFNLLVQQAIHSVTSSSHSAGMAKENGILLHHDNSPMGELVDYIMQNAIERRASDIHIEPAASPRIRYRIDGYLQETEEKLPEGLYSNLVSRIKLVSQLNIAETRLPQDGSFFYHYNGREYDVRVSVVCLINGEKVVLRLLNNADYFKGIDGINLSDINKQRLVDMCHRPNGAIIIAGPVNSGKTTALYAALSYINGIDRNIVSIEDPVEYHIDGICQLQINKRLGVDFDEALEAVLRQDYDVLAVGEIRNSNVADTLIKAALAGHLVFSSVHTASAVKTVYRLLDMGIKPYLLAAGIQGILSQRLVSKLCPYCREEYEVQADSIEASLLGESYYPGIRLFRRHGCDKCGNRGVWGRVAIHELLDIDDTVRTGIYQQVSLDKLEQQAALSGMISMWDDGISKAKEGLLDLKELSVLCGKGWDLSGDVR